MSNCCKYDCKSDVMQKEKNITNIIIFVLAGMFFIIPFFVQNEIIKIFFYGISVVLIGNEIIFEGLKNIFKLNFEEKTLMTIAVAAAFILGEYPEAFLVLFLFKLGEMLEDHAKDKSKKNIEGIASLKANNVNIEKNKTVIVKNCKDVQVGEKILIKPGEMIPLDCKIISGSTEINASAITGESKKIPKNEGDSVLSGSINLTGAIHAKVEKDLAHSFVSEVVDLVEEATENKGKSEEFITKFSKIYTPTIVVLAIMFVSITSISGILEVKEAIRRSLIFLVASCPCSLVISVPLAFFACVGTSAKKGMLIKGTKHIESLSKANIVAFDKTGTLTTGKMEIDNIEAFGKYKEKEILKIAASMEKLSMHPIASSFVNKVENQELYNVTEFKEIAGHGVYGKIDNKEILMGNSKLLKKYGIECKENEKIYITSAGKIIGTISLREEVLKESINAVNEINLRKIMLTGDSSTQAKKIAKKYKIKEVYSNLLPSQKQEKIKELKENNNIVICIGDGINDAPVLAEASFSISMGAGSEIAKVTSDAILINNKINVIPKIIELSKKTMTIVKTNIAFSIGVKLLVLGLGAAGIAPIWLAVLADTGTTFLTVLNSSRLMR